MNPSLKRLLLLGLLIGMFSTVACTITTRPGRSRHNVHRHDNRSQPEHQKHKKQKKQKKHKKQKKDKHDH